MSIIKNKPLENLVIKGNVPNDKLIRDVTKYTKPGHSYCGQILCGLKNKTNDFNFSENKLLEYNNVLSS